jgi:hypothetical protein
MRREQLIKDLAADLAPVRSPGRTGFSAAIWLAVATLYSSIIILATGPIREGSFGNTIAYPLFGLETLTAAAAIIALTIATLRTAIPSARHPLLRIAPALAICALWATFYIIGLWEPVHPVSMAGKRDHCVLQGLFFSFPSMALLLYCARGFMSLWPRATGALAGAAAGAIPAAWMQFACMYEPSHILMHHLGTALILVGIGAIVGPLALARRQTVPRPRSEQVH